MEPSLLGKLLTNPTLQLFIPLFTKPYPEPDELQFSLHILFP
jgi:hypothetical protein